MAERFDAERHVAFESASEFADRVLRFAARVPCLSWMLDEDVSGACECYGCAGRKYVALAAAVPPVDAETRND